MFAPSDGRAKSAGVHLQWLRVAEHTVDALRKVVTADMAFIEFHQYSAGAVAGGDQPYPGQLADSTFQMTGQGFVADQPAVGITHRPGRMLKGAIIVTP